MMGDPMKTTLTVFHDGQFFTGVFERESEDGYSAARVVFGQEPSDSEIFEFIRKRFCSLQFSFPSDDSATTQERRINPKRLQKMIRKDLSQQGTSTKAQNAIRTRLEMKKLERKEKSKEERDAEKEKQFLLKQDKKKKKHKGH
jgi:hypothetical protein